MSDGEEKWTEDEQSKEPQVSPSCSSSYVLDPIDQDISNFATDLFKKTHEYLQQEMTSAQEYYRLLEKLNRLVITKYANIHHFSVYLTTMMQEYNELFEKKIEPLLQKIEEADAKLSDFEASAYRLNHYTKLLQERFKELDDK